jgi:hypothetical protein
MRDANRATFRTVRELTSLLSSYAASIWHGKQPPLDHRVAADVYLHAAEIGDVRAAWNLGTMFLEGEGVARNAALALGLIEHASRHGDDSARNYLISAGEDVSSHRHPPSSSPDDPPLAPLDHELRESLRRVIDPDMTPERATIRHRIGRDLRIARNKEAYAAKFRRRSGKRSRGCR